MRGYTPSTNKEGNVPRNRKTLMTETADPLVLFMTSGTAGVRCVKAGIPLKGKDRALVHARDPLC